MSIDKAVIIRPPLELTSFEELKAQANQLGEMYKALMQEGTDYGVIPGTEKPSLLKPGAEILRLWTKLSPRFSVDAAGTDLKAGIFNYEVRCSLYNQEGHIVCEGVGACNSLESKYRYRWVWPNEVPEGMDKTKMVYKVFKGKKGQDFKKYRVDNENPQDQANTILKMAKKRAFVDGMLTVTGASRIFTQDMEDTVDRDAEELKTEPVAKPAPITKVTQTVTAGARQDVQDLYGKKAMSGMKPAPPAQADSSALKADATATTKLPAGEVSATGNIPQELPLPEGITDFGDFGEKCLLPHGITMMDLLQFAILDAKRVGLPLPQSPAQIGNFSQMWRLAQNHPKFKA